MEKRRNLRSGTRRRYRNQKSDVKEFVFRLLLKQLGVSVFLFLFIILLKFIPLKSTTTFIETVDQAVSYSMSWDEAVMTVKNTAEYIPVVKNWIEQDSTEDLTNQTQEDKENDILHLDTSDPLNENSDENKEFNRNNEEETFESVPVGNTEDIFILEPDLGESQEATVP